MTASLLTVSRIPAANASRRPSFFSAWTSSFLVFFYPRFCSRLWLSISPARACIVAAINFALALPWVILILVSHDAWNHHDLRVHNFLGNFVDRPLHAFLLLLGAYPGQLRTVFLSLNTLDQAAAVVGTLTVIVTLFTMIFFLLLPFAARPGANAPCVRHVVRTVLLGTGFIHLWAPVLSAAYMLFIIYRYPSGLENIIAPLLVVLIVLVLWSFAALGFAASREYRSPADYPQPHDPTCDRCGYNLIAASETGRCPECGKPVVESLGPDVRNPTPWERHPSPFNIRIIFRQLAQLIRHPQQLFFEMPTLTGHAAAHRWLLGALVLIAGEAFFIVPAFNWTRIAEIETTSAILGGIAVALVWSLLGLMMVGIETAGIATFSRMKGHPVTLATAAKVTAYSATLMLPWVILGGAQILAITWWSMHYANHYSIRTQQIVLVTSLGLAHIGGLLWYELTVYRGIRSVQYANR